MKVLFLDSNNEPVSYTLDEKKEIWQQSAGNKKIPIRNVIFWDRVAFIGGVFPVTDKCDVQIEPTSGNLNTIGVRYVVQKNGIEYVGFGSANDFSVIKTEKEIRDYSGNVVKDRDGKPKFNVSGSARYALEMAVKRARNNAIAAALRLTNDAAADYEESFDFILAPELKNQIKKNYHAPDLSVVPIEDDADEPDYSPSSSQAARTSTPASKPATTNSAPKTQESAPPPSTSGSTGKPANDPDLFKIGFGKHKGKTMLQVLHEDAKYIAWLAEESTNETVKATAAALLEKYQDLANMKTGSKKGGEDASATAPVKPHSHSAESEFHIKLRNIWTERKYTNQEAKDIIAKKLKAATITWGQVTATQAADLYADRELIFPPKADTLAEPPFEPINNAVKPSEDDTPKKCAACGQDLVAMEITFSEKYKDKYKGLYFCFTHQSDEAAINEAINKR